MSLNPIKLTPILFFLCFVMLSSRVYALPYRPDTETRILSTYRSSNENLPVYSHIWKLEREVSPDGKYILKFYPELQRSSEPICLLKIAQDGIIKDIEYTTEGGNRERTVNNGFLIVPDFPVPCNIIPVVQKDAAEVYEDRTRAGGRIFVHRYSVSYREVDLQEAGSNGWLREDLHEPVGLRMITVIDDNGHEVLRQLWPLDGTWWIYEETAMRRSWRISESYNVELENQ